MAEQQQVTTGAPAVDVPMTPEAASERIAELNSDKEWGAKFLAGDLAVRRESDRLLRDRRRQAAARTAECYLDARAG